jgi:hypothetical protein
MDDFEKGLCSRINERINVRGFCVVYDHELARICPPEAALRQKQIRVIEKFAAKHGLAVSVREIGINATFKKPPPLNGKKVLKPKNGARPKMQLQFANGYSAR